MNESQNFSDKTGQTLQTTDQLDWKRIAQELNGREEERTLFINTVGGGWLEKKMGVVKNSVGGKKNSVDGKYLG